MNNNILPKKGSNRLYEVVKMKIAFTGCFLFLLLMPGCKCLDGRKSSNESGNNHRNAPRLVPNDYQANQRQFDAVCLPETWHFMKDKWQSITRFPWVVVIDDGFFPTWDYSARYEIFPGYPDGSGKHPQGSAWGDQPPSGTVVSYGFHGTAVMSLLGSKANNNGFVSGIAGSWENIENGVKWGPYYYPVRIGNGGILSTSPGLLVDIFREHVLVHPEIRIVNISQSLIDISEAPGSAIEQVINEAHSKQIVLVAGAGNKRESRLADTWLAQFPNVIIVGGLNESGTGLWIEGDNFGTATGPAVDIYAPAQNLSIMIRDRDLRQDSGTSFATPFVTGIVSMMQNIKPSTLNDPQIIKDVLIKCADMIQVGNSDHSVPRLNAYRSIKCASTINISVFGVTENGVYEILGKQWVCEGEKSQSISGKVFYE